MAARKGQAPERQAQAADPAPVASTAESAAPPASAAPDPVILAVAEAPAPEEAPAHLTANEPADAEDAGLFPVLSPLRFNGRRYRPDDPDANEVVMPRDQADALIAIDVLGDELT